MPVILAVRNSSGQPESPPLRIERGEVVVGRGQGAHVLLASQSVSRRHCTISGDGANWRVVDSSSGGTFVNGQRIDAPRFLRHGDVIRVGESEIAVMIDQSATMPSPPPARDGWGRPVPAGATQVPGAGGPGPGGAGSGAAPDNAVGILLQAAGLSRGQVGASDQQVAAVAGAVLRAVLPGLARLAQDRRKAREDLGIAGGPDTLGSLDELLPRLLAMPPVDAAAQVSALCAQIDAHQRAILAAMQSSLHHALDQFSPASIKNSARGDADAWKAYETAFDARDGFVEVFAQALSTAYGKAVKV